jgi:protein-tyrosine phosphatase
MRLRALIQFMGHPRGGFGPATHGEQIVFGARRPGFPLSPVPSSLVEPWVAFMRQQAIRRVVCLLPISQLAGYRGDLLAIYRASFEEVCWAPIDDFHLADPYLLTNYIMPFLLRADRERARVVVHCAGGVGRTGHVLAAWLVAKYGLSNAQAIEAIRHGGRNARESRDPGLDNLLDTCRQLFVSS